MTQTTDPGPTGSAQKLSEDTDRMSKAPDWRRLDAAAREREYSPSSCIGGNYQPFIDAYRTRSAAARGEAQQHGGRWQTLAYGSQPMQRIELCRPAATDEPVGLLVFIHGGYWQELSSRDSLFAADRALADGLAFAAIDYTLAPAASLESIVAECRAAIDHLVAQAGALGIDPSRIVVAGSSAGAHLAAMIGLAGATTARLRAVVLMSGIYELEPLLGTSINQALGLDVARAQALSPQRLPVSGFPPTVVCWGEVETAEFKRQSLAFAQRLREGGSDCEVFEVPQRNHFDIVFELADPGSRLGRRLAGWLLTRAC